MSKDGNFHVILPICDDDSIEYQERLELFQEKLIQRTLAEGGTCTGEHGVGSGKSKYLAEQYGQESVDLLRLVKKAFDPNRIMNPGKIFVDKV